MLFKKKSTSARGAPKAKSAVELITDNGGNKALVFGITWRSVATAGGRDAAAKIARSERATHFTYRGSQIGFGIIPGKAKDLPPALYPAAMLAAKQHAGDSIYVLRVYDDEGESTAGGSYWIALIRNGLPTSTDRFIEGIDDAEALAMAREIVHPLISDDIKIGFYTNIERSGVDGAKLSSVEDLLDIAIIDEDRLQLVPRGGITIPKPVLGVIALAVVFLVGQRLYAMYDESERAKLAAQNAVVEEDPTVAWDRVINNWHASVSGPNARGLDAVRASMSDLPAKWDGWMLSRSACAVSPSVPAPAGADGAPAVAQSSSVVWSCTAGYERQQIGKLTRDMVNQIPERWRVSFTPLNQMQLSWEVKVDKDPMSIGALPKQAHHNIETVSKLQQFSPAMSTAATFMFRPVDIAAPVSTTGAIFPPDSRTEGLTQADLQLRGPMRSIDALLNAGIDATWTSITLVYSPAASQADIRSSVITAEATGVLYAKN